MKFYGYPRPDGKVGARNYVAIIPTVGCVNPVVSKVVSTIRGTVAIRHDQGCLHPPLFRDSFLLDSADIQHHTAFCLFGVLP